jgi:hypothetical protein
MLLILIVCVTSSGKRTPYVNCECLILDCRALNAQHPVSGPRESQREARLVTPFLFDAPVSLR